MHMICIIRMLRYPFITLILPIVLNPSLVVTYPKAPSDSGPDGKMQQREDFKSVSCAVQNFMLSMWSGKSAFVLFYCVNSSVQYEVSITWPLQLNFICLYLIVLATHMY